MDVPARVAARVRAGELDDLDARRRSRRAWPSATQAKTLSARAPRAAGKARVEVRGALGDHASAGATACGRVSVAVTKIAAGSRVGDGTREKGRVRSAVQSPDSSSSARTASASGRARRAARSSSKATARDRVVDAITTETSARRSPRWIARDGAAGRRGVAHAGTLLVFEQGLPERDAVADLDLQRRLQAGIIGPEHARRTRPCAQPRSCPTVRRPAADPVPCLIEPRPCQSAPPKATRYILHANASGDHSGLCSSRLDNRQRPALGASAAYALGPGSDPAPPCRRSS